VERQGREPNKKEFFMKNFSKKGFNKALEIIAIAAMISIGLAGCGDDSDDSNDPGPSIPSGTVKLADTGDNTFTLTLTGLTWKEDTTVSFGGDYGSLSPLALDGSVTAENTGIDSKPVEYIGDIEYDTTRISDTVLKVTMSKKYSTTWGSGKVKLSADVNSGLALLLSSINEYTGLYTDNPNNRGDFQGKFTVAADSGSAVFNIPRQN
jgi:hypothetical protein